ncbi:Protein ACCELERATED CELL DEATH 6, partial [Bienertia sinuspersici]
MASTTNQNNPVIDSKLYQLLVTGDPTASTDALNNIRVDVVADLRCESAENNVLHIAASLGHVDLVSFILDRWPRLMVEGNSEGDLPIHSALKSGKLKTVEALTSCLRLPGNEAVADEVLRAKNGEENTPLHIALEYDYREMAKELVELYPRAAYAMNDDGICPLYLAVQKQLPDLVRHMLFLLLPFKSDTLASLSQGKSILHAALKEILEEMLSYDDEELLKLRDAQGWTALSYAACNRSVEMVRVFQKKVPNSAFVSNKDEDTSFPIHVAVHGGNIEIIDSLANTWSQFDAKYRNILHIAALTGSSQIVRHVLTRISAESESLINQKDKDGNTPLHLAILAKCVEVVDILIQDNRVDVKLSNKVGLTANDLAKNLIDTNAGDKGIQRLKLVVERSSKGLKNHDIVIGSDLYYNLGQESINGVEMILGTSSVQFQDLISLEDGCNILHFIASMHNPDPFVSLLSGQDCTDLMEQANLKGDLPIHAAAKAGNFTGLENLFRVQCNNGGVHVCERRNMNGNTALHEALINNHFRFAKDLYGKHTTAAYCLNKENVCPLFLAIKKCSNSETDLIRDMIAKMEGNQDIQDRLKDARSVVHVAILVRRVGQSFHLPFYFRCLEVDNQQSSRLVDSFDSRGRSPLSYAAFVGFVEGVSLLLKHDPSLEFKRDNDMDGSFPIHYAARGGHLKVLLRLTLSEMMLKNNEQNALHEAAKTGRSSVVEYLLKKPKFKKLLNTGDKKGNTPLHLAVQGFHSEVVLCLVNEEHIDGKSTNKELLTARDLFQRHPTISIKMNSYLIQQFFS